MGLEEVAHTRMMVNPKSLTELHGRLEECPKIILADLRDSFEQNCLKRYTNHITPSKTDRFNLVEDIINIWKYYINIFRHENIHVWNWIVQRLRKNSRWNLIHTSSRTQLKRNSKLKVSQANEERCFCHQKQQLYTRVSPEGENCVDAVPFIIKVHKVLWLNKTFKKETKL